MLPADIFELLLIAQICQELGDGLAARGHPQLGRDLRQRGEEELPLSKAWMGDLKCGSIHLDPLEQQQVDVEGARSKACSSRSPGSEL